MYQNLWKYWLMLYVETNTINQIYFNKNDMEKICLYIIMTVWDDFSLLEVERIWVQS